jgi:hypothetical protein
MYQFNMNDDWFAINLCRATCSEQNPIISIRYKASKEELATLTIRRRSEMTATLEIPPPFEMREIGMEGTGEPFISA